MKVNELIKILQKYDQNKDVVIASDNCEDFYEPFVSDCQNDFDGKVVSISCEGYYESK